MKELFVSCASGLELLLAEELKELGINGLRRGFCGVYVPKSMENVYRVNYCSRLATRVLWPLLSFQCKDAKALYENARQLDWKLYIQPHQTFAIDSHVKHPLLRNSLHAAQVVKDALCDVLREEFGSRPSVDTAQPDVPFHLFIDKGRATISFDTSGAPLYKRGWRQFSTLAPIQESLAAALLMTTRYKKDEPFCDPFCGSGTFLIEAAMIATETPAGYFRNQWSFFHFPEFSDAQWQSFKERQNQNIIPLEKGAIFGSDRDAKTAAICQEHIKKTPFANITVSQEEIKRYTPPCAPHFLLCNPPYGKRLELSTDTYSQLSAFVKAHTSRTGRAFFLAPFEHVGNMAGLLPSKYFSFFNGGSKVHLYLFRG